MRLLFGGKESTYFPSKKDDEPKILESIIDNTEPNGRLQWLIDAPEEDQSIDAELKHRHKHDSKYLNELQHVLEELDLRLPESFARLLQDCRLRDKVVPPSEGYWGFRRRKNGMPRT